MVKTDRFVALIIIGVSIYLYTRTGRFLDETSVDPISAAFFPRAILIALMACSAWLVLKSKMPPAVFPAPAGVALGAVQIVVYVMLIEPVGYFIVTPLFLLIFPATLGYRRWGWLAGLALGGTVLAYGVFTRVLGVPLPMGVLENIGGLS